MASTVQTKEPAKQQVEPTKEQPKMPRAAPPREAVSLVDKANENKQAQAKQKSETESYKVKKGDTLFEIAEAHKISVDKLKDLNPELKGKERQLSIGQEIKVPAKKAPESPPKVTAQTEKKPSSTEEEGKAKQNTFVELKKGETLGLLAKRAGCSLDEIYRLNPSLKGKENTLQIGQKISVPGEKTELDSRNNAPFNMEKAKSFFSEPAGPELERRINELQQALKDVGLGEPKYLRYALATIHAEHSGKFSTQQEIPRNKDKPFHEYDGRKDLGNTEPGDGARFCGRGYVQITGRWNYTHYAKLTGIPFDKDPGLAMETKNAAAIMASFMKENVRQISSAIARRDVEDMRRVINPKLNGLGRFREAYTHFS